MDTAVPSVRHNMFSYLSPWLLNVELVNSDIPDCPFVSLHSKDVGASPFSDKNSSAIEFKTLLEGQGWGSGQATAMVLTNLMFLTVKYGDEHVEALEYLWQELAYAFPNNLSCIIKHLIILSGISPKKLLPYVSI